MILRISESEQMQLKRAILLYEAPQGKAAFATLHDVANVSGGAPVITAGECLTREVLDDTLQLLQKRPQRREVLPASVLWFGDSRLCWYTPAQRRPIFFQTRDKAFNGKMNGREVLHPRLVFLAKPGHLAVWALASDERPTGDTKLYQAPYYNIYDYGAMCNGNARLPDVPAIESIPLFERAFFETNFTHSNASKLVKLKDGHDAFWRLQASKYAHVPGAETLLPVKLTLQEALNQ